MNSLNRRHNQAGFSLLEMLLSMGLMMVLMGIVFTVARDSFRTSFVAMELTEAQEGMRAAHEIISRDLISAGDGLNGINNIRLPVAFVNNYLTANPVLDPFNNNFVNLSVMTSDNNVPAGRAVLQTAPAVTVRSSPAQTDRMTLLQIDPTFTPVALPGNAILPAGANITVSAADIGRFSIGNIVFITSAAGATFGTITNITAGNVLVLGNGDQYGMNQAGNAGPIGFVSGGGTLPASLMRMMIVHYFVNSNGLLIRRVFGVPGGIGFRDSVIAEHVTDLQFRYALNLFNPNGTIMQPVAQLANGTQQVNVRQVEVALTIETTHGVLSGNHPTVKMTTSTSVRNMQFRQSLQPGSGG